jgi:hypothetical protein
MGLEPQTRLRVLAIGVIALALVQLQVASGHSVAGDDQVAQLHTSFSSDKSIGNVEISVGDQAWLKSHDTCVVHHGDLLCSSNGGLVLAPSGR